jgi:hypothetical protein
VPVLVASTRRFQGQVPRRGGRRLGPVRGEEGTAAVVQRPVTQGITARCLASTSWEAWSGGRESLATGCDRREDSRWSRARAYPGNIRCVAPVLRRVTRLAAKGYIAAGFWNRLGWLCRHAAKIVTHCRTRLYDFENRSKAYQDKLFVLGALIHVRSLRVMRPAGQVCVSYGNGISSGCAGRKGATRCDENRFLRWLW